jgi:radical SAM protein with 4Fe4S-binding SPASM domain
MCPLWKHELNRKEISITEWTKVAYELKNWLKEYNALITGGEPFIREEVVFALIQKLSTLNITTVIDTNGVLIDQRLAKDIVKSGLNVIRFSLDSMNPKIHDFIRGVNGTHEKVLQAINYLLEEKKRQKSDIKILIGTIIMGLNLDDVLQVVNFVYNKGLDGVRIQPLLELPGYSIRWYKDNNLWPNSSQLKEINRIIDELIRLKTRRGKIYTSISELRNIVYYYKESHTKRNKGCLSGLKQLKIDPYGNVFLCSQFGCLGNVKDKPIYKIWNSSRGQDIRKKIKNCTKICFGCQHNINFREKIIKGCRTLCDVNMGNVYD